MHVPIEGVSIGQHPLVSRLLKGVFHSRPPIPKYSKIWDVSRMLMHLSSMKVDRDTPLKLLTLKTVILLALSRPSRSVDLANLEISNCQRNPEGFSFRPGVLPKQGGKLAVFLPSVQC